MPGKTASLCRAFTGGQWGFRREASHVPRNVHLRLRAFYHTLPALHREGDDAVTGQEGELASLRDDVSSRVGTRDFVLMQLCACGKAPAAVTLILLASHDGRSPLMNFGRLTSGRSSACWLGLCWVSATPRRWASVTFTGVFASLQYLLRRPCC